MFQQRLRIKVRADKSKEFIQCWQNFVQYALDVPGTSFRIKQKDKNTYELIFQYREKEQMKQLIQSEWYAFLLGGIHTLSEKYEEVAKKK